MAKTCLVLVKTAHQNIEKLEGIMESHPISRTVALLTNQNKSNLLNALIMKTKIAFFFE